MAGDGISTDVVKVHPFFTGSRDPRKANVGHVLRPVTPELSSSPTSDQAHDQVEEPDQTGHHDIDHEGQRRKRRKTNAEADKYQDKVKGRKPQKKQARVSDANSILTHFGGRCEPLYGAGTPSMTPDATVDTEAQGYQPLSMRSTCVGSVLVRRSPVHKPWGQVASSVYPFGVRCC